MWGRGHLPCVATTLLPIPNTMYTLEQEEPLSTAGWGIPPPNPKAVRAWGCPARALPEGKNEPGEKRAPQPMPGQGKPGSPPPVPWPSKPFPEALAAWEALVWRACWYL